MNLLASTISQRWADEEYNYFTNVCAHLFLAFNGTLSLKTEIGVLLYLYLNRSEVARSFQLLRRNLVEEEEVEEEEVDKGGVVEEVLLEIEQEEEENLKKKKQKCFFRQGEQGDSD